MARPAAGEVDELERLGDAPPDLCLVDLAALEAERDVPGDVEVVEERVALKHHVDVALVGRDVLDRLALEQNVPSVGSSNPASMRSVVVLPQPDGPSSEKNSPSAISRLTWSTATCSPKRLVTFWIPIASAIESPLPPVR